MFINRIANLNNTNTFVEGKSDDTPFWGVNPQKLSEAINNLKDYSGSEKLVVILARHIKEIDKLDVKDIQELLKITKHLGKSFQNSEAVKLLRNIYSYLISKQESKALQNIKSVFDTTNYT